MSATNLLIPTILRFNYFEFEPNRYRTSLLKFNVPFHDILEVQDSKRFDYVLNHDKMLFSHEGTLSGLNPTEHDGFYIGNFLEGGYKRPFIADLRNSGELVLYYFPDSKWSTDRVNGLLSLIAQS